MKNFNLTLAIINSSEKITFNNDFLKNDYEPIISEEWLRRKSLSTKTIKNYKTIVECIINIIKENLPPTIVNKIKLKENCYYITSEESAYLLNIIDDFTTKYKIIIQKELAQIIYIYEIKTLSEILKEINSHLKFLSDYLNELEDNRALLIIGEYSEKPIYK